MSDKEIIKALECCPLPGGCGVCPYNNGDLTDCDARICRDALHLITCQKSQIEDLKEALEERMEIINALIAGQETLQKHIDTMRTAAIREFAERLKERWTIASPEPYTTDAAEVLDSIDTIVKEMTEDTDNANNTLQ